MHAAVPTLDDYARQSAYSDPGEHGGLLTSLDPTPAALGATVCTAVVHYRAGDPVLTGEQRADIDRRWADRILDAAVARQPGPLHAPRPRERQVAGCCRDHTLLSVATLRAHGFPARSRIGFAGYLEPGFFHDHVVVEHWDGERWVRWDPEMSPDDDHGFDVHDMPTGPGSPFPTAAEVWRAIRAGDVAPASYGVDRRVPELCGTPFVRAYVFLELAHRMREEVLLWDSWGIAPDMAGADRILGRAPSGVLALDGLDQGTWDATADEVAALLVAADAGDADAETALAARWADGLGPGDRVLTLSPSGRLGVTDLRARTTRWD